MSTQQTHVILIINSASYASCASCAMCAALDCAFGGSVAVPEALSASKWALTFLLFDDMCMSKINTGKQRKKKKLHTLLTQIRIHFCKLALQFANKLLSSFLLPFLPHFRRSTKVQIAKIIIFIAKTTIIYDYLLYHTYIIYYMYMYYM